LFLIGASSAQDIDSAQRVQRPQITSTALGGDRYRVVAPLSELRAAAGPLHLRGARASETISVPVAPGVSIESARLRLRHTGSLGMMDARPHLRISLNDSLLAQLQTPRAATTTAHELGFDPSRLRGGYNSLTFEAIQRYTDACQDPNAAELWTEVDTLASEVELVYRRRAFSGRLSDLDQLMAPGLGGAESLAVLTAGESVSADQLRWGALVVQGLANRMRYRLPEISHVAARRAARPAAYASPAPMLDPSGLAGSDVVLVGTFAQLRPFMAPAANAQRGAYIEIGPSPADHTRFLLLIAGETPAEVMRAATALGLINFPFANAASAHIGALDIPDGYVPAMDNIVHPEQTYSFADFGLATTTRAGLTPNPIELVFDAPADFWVAEESEVVLQLDFAYGAGMREDSVVNVTVNGLFQRALSLSEAAGGLVNNYELRLPARAFRPGRNRVSFEIALAARQTGECAFENDRNLLFSLRDSSTISFPPASRFVELPNLRLLGETGFPFAGANGQPFAVRLTDDAPETVAAAWTMMARLGQIHRSLALTADFGFGEAPRGLHTLVIGARPELAAAGDEANDLTNAGFIQVSSTSRGSPVQSRVDLSALGGNGLLISGESTRSHRRLLAVLTAQSPHALLEATRDLVAPSRWSQLDGRAAVWRPDADAVATQPVGETFHAGDLDRAQRASYVFSSNAVGWIGGITAVLAALAGGLTYLSRRLRRADPRQTKHPPT
jgi:hypothetical protein